MTFIQVSKHSLQVRQYRSKSIYRKNNPSTYKLRIMCVATSTKKHIELIVSDIDGTLLNSNQVLSQRTIRAIHAAADAGVPMIIATGKALGPWREDVLPYLPSSNVCPRIYLQGLLITDHTGLEIYSRALEKNIILDAIQFAKRKDLTLVAYCGDRIVCESTDKHTDRLNFYKEPPPESIGDLARHAETLPIQKLIFMAQHDVVESIRPEVEAIFPPKSASLTAALSGMLEVLPPSSSKGSGVEWVLRNRLGLSEFSSVMALGDGDNDVEMLNLVGLGVAMGNAGPNAKAAANVTVSTNDEDGVAEAIEKYVLNPRGISL